MDTTQRLKSGSFTKRIGGNLAANLSALGVSGIAFIVTALGIFHYWDRLVWPLVLPMVLAWMSWSFLVVKLTAPTKISRQSASEAERFESLAKQALFLFWCCWQWGLLIYVAQAGFRYTGRIQGGGSIFEAALGEFVTASAAMYPTIWLVLAVLFSLFVFFLIARWRTIRGGSKTLVADERTKNEATSTGLTNTTAPAPSVPLSPVVQAGTMAAIALSIPLILGFLVAFSIASSDAFANMLLGFIPPSVSAGALTFLVAFLIANSMKKRGRDPRKTAALSGLVAVLLGFASFVVGIAKYVSL